MNELHDLLAPEPPIDIGPSGETAQQQQPLTHPGVRLMSVEVLNWGTFHKHVWRLDLMGGNGLLTGQNGAGKSTLVDAITTLLVPAHRINYNKAGQADRDERDLRSYVLGTYKSERATTGGAKPVSLRTTGSTYAVILGRFHNADFNETTTLAQVFWFREQHGQPARFYVVAESALSIQEHFTGFGREIGALRKRLRKQPGTEVYDSYPSYGADFRRRFGIAGEQAIDLFLQTVSMKTVGDLTGFVRSHMLEPFPVEARIKDMIRHFDDLTRAHGEVVKARDQIEQLTPIVADCDRHAEIAQDVLRMTDARHALKAYMAADLRALIDERVASLDSDLARLAQRIAGLRVKEAENEQARLALERDINANGGERLGQIELESRQKMVTRDDRRRRANAYGELAAACGIAVPKSPEQFADSLADARRQLLAIREEESALQNRRVEQGMALRDERELHDKHIAEIASLKQRRSNLPAPMIALRERLCQEVGVASDTMPFAGELIEVRKEATDWEGAAERLLHSFAMTLLVPERLYDTVAAWVDRTHIAARLVYFRVLEDVPAQRPRRDPKALSEKLRLKDDTPLYQWLQREVDRRFNHICCTSIEEFRREPTAVTRSGQIKTGGYRHEKDDRHRIDDRTRYVLGWSNTAKIAALEAEVRVMQSSIQALADEVAGVLARIRVLTDQTGQFEKLSAYESFSDIDWASVALDIDALEEERRALTEGSDVLKALHARQNDLKIESGDLRSKLEAATNDEAKLSERRDELQRRRAAAEADISNVSDEQLAQARPTLDPLRAEILGQQKLTIENCNSRESDVRKALQDRIDTRQASLRALGERLVRTMRDYGNQYQEETRDVDASVDAADEYRRMLTSLREEGLPRFEAQFKALLNENAIREVAGFQSKLREEERTIRDRIETINASLRDIDYHDGTYISVEPTSTLDAEIREFQQDLRKCTENTLTGSEDNAYAEAKFLEVKRVIERFRGRDTLTELDQRWTRKVTDVRNWFEFSASERWRSDHSEREHYSDSGGKSGGQKEKLAYTILAASLAYQFGLDKGAERSRAFHFVMIDEAFGRGSDEAAEFGLTLFQKMGLQLLIATPLQKIHVIEPHVAAVGFVHNEDGKHSLLRNMTIEEYREEKRSRAASAIHSSSV